MPNHRQSDKSPCIFQPYLLIQVTQKVNLEILIPFKTITPRSIKIKAIQLKIRSYWFFQNYLNSFQDHCFNTHKFNISGSIWPKRHQNKCQPLNCKFLNLLCPNQAIVTMYEQIWQTVKTTHKSLSVPQ